MAHTYYFIEIKVVDGEESRAIYLKDSIDEAEKAFHESLAYNINLQGCDRVLAMVMNEQGTVQMKQFWLRTIQ